MNVYVVDVISYDYNRGQYPKTIRSPLIKRIAWSPQGLYVGKTDKCEYAKALVAANAMCDQLNSAGDQATIDDIIGAGGSA